MTKKALIVWGGWDGHVPDQMAAFFEELLKAENYDVTVSDSLASFSDAEKLKTYDLIVPCITMEKIEEEWADNVCEAVSAGTGLAGCHGGMCDAFREHSNWQFMTGGQFVAHPGNDGTEYTVCIEKCDHELIQGLEDFSITTEQYYMHVDPAIDVLAYTMFPVADGPHLPNGPCRMPVAWTKRWGEGNVYYNALGHIPENINSGAAREMIRRGFLWATR
ncbi:ThuA domain-containing protein [Pontiellaceae bacterium B12227]|nr:ThuA domain-containing protein [Pontiellaceae bacterium B12227]